MYEPKRLPNQQPPVMPNARLLAPQLSEPNWRDKGDQLLLRSYQTIAAAIGSDTAFQHHIASLPSVIWLNHSCRLPHKGETFTLCKKSPAAEAELHCHGTAGSILQSQVPDELTSLVALQLAPTLCKHEAESDSYRLFFNTCAAASALALSIGGMHWFGACTLAAGLHWLSRSNFIDGWLHRQQIYEQDAVAASISLSAGCSPGSLVTGLQHAYVVHAVHARQSVLYKQRRQRIHWHLARIQQLLSEAPIPKKPFDDSRGLHAVTDVAASSVSVASVEVQAQYQQAVDAIEDCLTHDLYHFMKSLFQWGGAGDPDLLDRITHLQNSSSPAHELCCAQTTHREEANGRYSGRHIGISAAAFDALHASWHKKCLTSYQGAKCHANSNVHCCLHGFRLETQSFALALLMTSYSLHTSSAGILMQKHILVSMLLDSLDAIVVQGCSDVKHAASLSQCCPSRPDFRVQGAI